jgi:formyl-CoA transferase
MSASPIEYKKRAPLIGEHNREIYTGELGMGEQELQGLQEKGVI